MSDSDYPPSSSTAAAFFQSQFQHTGNNTLPYTTYGLSFLQGLQPHPSVICGTGNPYEIERRRV